MKKLCMLTAAALALMLLAGCSAQEEETEPLPESMDQETVLAAAILHDISIRYCKETCGDACQENQRREAVRMVPEFLQKAGYPPEAAERVLPLVLRHHCYEETIDPLLQKNIENAFPN